MSSNNPTNGFTAAKKPRGKLFYITSSTRQDIIVGNILEMLDKSVDFLDWTNEQMESNLQTIVYTNISCVEEKEYWNRKKRVANMTPYQIQQQRNRSLQLYTTMP
jgi:hypothetical protein